MANLFDSTNYPETEPLKIFSGDRAAWKRTDLGTDYAPASYSLNIQQGWKMMVRLKLKSPPQNPDLITL